MSNQDEAKILNLNPSTLTDPNVSPDIWIERYANINNIQYHYKTNSVRENGEPIEAGLFISQMRLCTHRLGMGNIKKMLPDAFLVWRKEQGRRYLRSLRNELKFESSSTDLVADWVEAATGKRDPLNIIVIRHFIWQVRRKLFGLSVEHHMMIVLFGASGGGKSVAVHKLIGPLEDVSTLRDLTIFNDQFSRRAFSRSFIMFFDELSKSSQTDVNALKNVVSAPIVEWRGMGSEAVHSAKQNCTFIGCSNAPVRERIHDPTSSRRFWQLNCAEKLNWEKINSMDYTTLWKSVDENEPCPILPYLEQTRSVQESEIKHQDLVENWLESSCEPHPFGPNSPNTDTLFSAFSDWARMQCIYDFDGFQTFARGFQRHIQQLRWNYVSSKRSNRGTVWSLRLKIDQPDDLKKIFGLAVGAEAVAVSSDPEPTEPYGGEE